MIRTPVALSPSQSAPLRAAMVMARSFKGFQEDKPSALTLTRTIPSTLPLYVLVFYFDCTVLTTCIGFFFGVQGFDNPEIGTYKAGVTASASAEDGYNCYSADGGSIESPLYEAKDADGKTVTLKFHISATPSRTPQFVISELRY